MLNDDDYKIIKKLITISKIIYIQYMYLAELEIHDLKDTYKFKEIMNKIESLKEMENELYDKLEFIEYKIPLIINELYKIIDKDHLDYQYNVVPERIILKLGKKCAEFDAKKEEPSLLEYSMYDKIKEDTFNGTISLLESQIRQEQDNDIKRQLVYIKYAMMFSDEAIDEIYKSKNYNVEYSFIAVSKLCAELASISIEEYEYDLHAQNYQIALNQINQMYVINDDELENPIVKTNQILSKCFLSSAILCLNDQKRQDLKLELEKNKNELGVTNPRNNISISEIEKTLENGKYVQSRRLVISTKMNDI